MATNDYDIANLALAEIGNNRRISSLSEATLEAQTCNLWYAHCRDELFGAFEWPFASTRTELTTEVTNYTYEGWTYVYALPSDCIEVRRIWSGARVGTERAEQRIPFEVVDDDANTRQLLLTDMENPVVFYTRRHATISRWKPYFVDALVWRLAAAIAIPLGAKKEVVATAYQNAGFYLRQGMATALNSRQEDPEPANTFVAARG